MAKVGLGLALLAVGVVWFLQGINVLPGSFMTGRSEYAVLGGILIVAGLGLAVWGARSRRP